MAYNKNYGKLTSGKIEYAPAVIKDGDKYIVVPTESAYIQHGWLPIVDKAPTDPAPDGYHWESASWKQENDQIVRVYTAVENPPAPPRKFSKLKLYAALEGVGLWGVFETWLQSQTIAGVNGYTAFSLAQDLSDDHPLFNSLYAAAKSALGVSDEDAEMILESAREA